MSFDSVISRMKGLGVLAWVVCSASAEEPRRATIVKEAPAGPAEAGVASQSGQFRVTGGDPGARGALALLAESARREFRETCGLKGGWKIPVEIRLPGSATGERPILTGLVDVEGMRLFTLDIRTGEGVDHEAFKRAVYALLIYDMAIEAGVDPDARLVAMPWLVEGLIEAAAWRKGEVDRRLYRALFESGGLFRLEELLGMEEGKHRRLDGATRAAFRVSAGSLVTALLEQPQGKEGFRGFLKEAASFAGEAKLVLSRHFPELNLSGNGLDKLWRLQMANKGGLNSLHDVLSVKQTEDALHEALQLDLRNGEGLVQRVPLAQWKDALKMEEAERDQATRGAEDALVRLSYRCFPSYRPLLVEYQRLLAAVRSGKPNDVDKKLAELDETREVMVARSAHGRDYLDWFEITRARETSGAFEDYLKLKQELKSPPRARASSTSRYLDRMNATFHRE